MVRSAAKNFEDVAIVTRVSDYPALIEELQLTRGSLSRETRWRLARQAFALTSAYDSAIADTLDRIADGTAARCAGLARRQPPFPRPSVSTSRSPRHCAMARIPTSAPRSIPTAPAWVSPAHTSSRAKNLASTISWISKPVGSLRRSSTSRWSPSSSTPTLAAQPPAPPSLRPTKRPWHATRFQPLAASLASTGPWMVRPPPKSASCLSRPLPPRRSRPRPANALRLKRIYASSRFTPRQLAPVVKHVSGGLLLQDADTGRVTEAELKVVTWRPPTAEELRSLLFAWRVCKHVKSNAIVYARDGQTVGVGAGQMSRVDAARFGAQKAVLPLQGTVAASDAFFPFPDGLEAVAQAGATAVIQPGGRSRIRT